MNESATVDVNAKRFVAFVDILGMKRLMSSSQELGDFLRRYEVLFLDQLKEDVERYGIAHHIFSDSLFVWAESRYEDQQFLNLVTFCQRLLVRSIAQSLPIRGAIAHGVAIVKRNLIVGPGIIEAVECEQSQEWIGIVLAPSAAQYLRKNEKLVGTLSHRLIRYNVPVKPSPNTLLAWAVTPRPEDLEDARSLKEQLNALMLEAGTADAQLKCANTAKYFDFVQGRGLGV